MANLRGIIPDTVDGQLHLIEELSAAPLEDLRPLIAVVLTTFLVERRELEIPNMYIDAIDAVLRTVREQGRMAIAVGGTEASPLLTAIAANRQRNADLMASGVAVPTTTGGEEAISAAPTAYQPRTAD